MRLTNRSCSQCGAPRAFIDGAWLRQKRIKAGLSGREVARRLGYTASYICDVELNRRNASKNLAERFMRALSIAGRNGRPFPGLSEGGDGDGDAGE